MAKRLNVNLAFTADTRQAKAQVQDLQRQLETLSRSALTHSQGFGLTKDVQEATMAVAQLQSNLTAATNVDTGKLDLSRFKQSMDASGMSLEKYQEKLADLGPAGDAAFANLANAILKAEIPLRRSNTYLSEMWTTLKNTARWQISSSIMHGFMGTLQTAYGYAQNLNHSLNEIRIVSGQSTEQMAKFAIEANNAAKSLSTSTTRYTDAALIFYQQGLGDAEVKERTEAVIKMANVTGEEAADVSSYMTAIWNNFDDGSKSLEYYGDVLAKLGAETAASSEEIAAGLEKFVAIGDTVGLSYEYATAAITTVVDKTRQSADTVGTAFKTIFSRLQGLQLGETLEDGTTLNKYSSALATVGINIMDTNGELRAMDDILDELGSKWSSLDKATQTALAQTVGGARQYTQLIALLDNYESFQENINTALTSEGALQEQADIYAESWEASRNRVKAAAQDMYDSLINDEFFIDLNSGIETTLNGISGLIDGIGGVKGILLSVMPIFTTLFQKQILSSIGDIRYNFKSLTSEGRKNIEEIRENANSLLKNSAFGKEENASAMANSSAFKQQGILQEAYYNAAHKMNEEQERISKNLLDQQQYLITNVRLAGEQLEIAKQQAEASEFEFKKQVKIQAYKKSREEKEGNVGKAKAAEAEIYSGVEELRDSYKEYAQFEKARNQIETFSVRKGNKKEDVERLKTWAKSIEDIDYSKVYGDEAQTAYENFTKSLKNSKSTIQQINKDLEKFLATTRDTGKVPSAIVRITELLEELDFKEPEKALNALLEGYGEIGEQSQRLSSAQEKLNNYTKNVKKSFEELQSTVTFGEQFLAAASSIGMLTSAFNILSGVIDTLNDKDLSFGDKVMAILSGAAMFTPTIVQLLKEDNIATLASIMLKKQRTEAIEDETKELEHNAHAQDDVNKEKKEEIVTEVAGNMVPSGKSQVPKTGTNAATKLALSTVGKVFAVVAIAAIVKTIWDQVWAGIKERAQVAADEANEEMAKAIEETQTQNNLINEYKKALKTYQDTGEGKSQLVEVTNKLAEAYELEGAALANLSDNYETINEQIRAKQKQTAEENIDTAQDAIDANAKDFENDMRDKTGRFTYAGKNKYVVDTFGFTSEIDLVKLLEGVNIGPWKADYIKEANYTNASKITTELTLSTGTSTNDLMAAYEGAERARDALRENIEDVEELAFYKNLVEWINKSTDSYNKLAEAKKLLAENTALLNLYNNDEISNVQSVEDYNALVEQLTKDYIADYNKNIEDESQMIGEEEARDVIENLLSTFPELEDYKTEAQLLEDAAKLASLSKEQLTNYYSSLSEEDRDLFVRVNFDKVYSIEQLDKQIELLRNKADLESIKLRIELYTDLQSTLDSEEALDAETLAKLQETYSWGENGLPEWVDFLKSSRTEQQDLISELLSSEKDEILFGAISNKEGIEKIIQETRAELNGLYGQVRSSSEAGAAKSKIESLEADIQRYEQQLAEAEQEIALQSKIVYEERLADIKGTIDSTDQLLEMLSSGEIDEDLYTDAYNKVLENELSDKGFDTEELEDYTDHLQQLAGYSKDVSENLLSNQEGAEDVALAALRLNKGLADLIDNYEEYYSVLSSANQGTAEYLEALNNVRTDLTDLLAIDIDTLPDSFITSANTLNLLSAAANGSEQAITDLRLAAANALLDEANLNNELDELIALINSQDWNLEIGTSIEDVAFYDKLNELLKAGTLTAEQLQAILDSVGFEPDVDYQKVTSSMQLKNGQTVYVPDGTGGYTAQSYDSSAQSELDFYIPIINAKKTVFKGPPSATISQDNKNKAKDKQSKKKDEKDPSGEIERYHVVKEKIEDINNVLEDLDKAKSRAFGTDKLKMMDKEIIKMNDLIAAQKDYLSQIEDYYDKDKAAIAAYGAQFDENGVITNYDTIMQQQIKKYNDAVATYNVNQDEDAFEKAEKEYEKFQNILSQYEETSDLLAEETQALTDMQNEQFDAMLDKLKYKIDLQIDFSDDELEYLDYLLNKIEDSAFDTAKAIALIGDKAEEVLNQGDIYQSGLNELFANHGLGNDTLDQLIDGRLSTKDLIGLGLTESEVETIKDYRDNLLKTNETLMELQQTIHDELIEAFQDMEQELDDEIDNFEHFNKVLSDYEDIIDIIGTKVPDISKDLLESLDQEQMNNLLNELSSVKNKLDEMQLAQSRVAAETAKAADEAAQAQLNSSLSQAEKDYLQSVADDWQDNLDEINASVQQAEEDFLSSWKETLEKASELFETEMTRAIEEVSDKLAGALGSLDALEDAFDKQGQLDDQYLADYRQIYELSKLTRDIEGSIDDTDNIKGKQRLKELLEDINEIEAEGVEMSEYDLDYMRAKYELRLAEIALEEAQNAKSQVRMTRDNEGNWSYTYVADEANVESARGDYEAKLYAMQDLSTKYAQETQNKLVEIETKMIDEIKNLDANAYATKDEYLQAVDDIVQHYTEQEQYYMDELGKALGNNQELYYNDWTRYHEATGYKISDMNEFLMNFDQTVLGMATGYKTMEEYQNAFNQSLGSPDSGTGMLGAASEAYDNWRERVDKAMEAAGTSTEDFGEKVDSTVQDIADDSEEAKETVQELGDVITETFGGQVDAVVTFEEQYNSMASNMISDNEAIIESLSSLITEISNTKYAMEDLSNTSYTPTVSEKINTKGSSLGGMFSSGGLLGMPNNSGDKELSDWERELKEVQRELLEGRKTTAWKVVFKDDIDRVLKDGLTEMEAYQYADELNTAEKKWKYSVVKMNTGGYTGEWGASGRLAVLHEKELVLNKEDTNNILSAVSIIRDISQMIDLNARAASTGLGLLNTAYSSVGGQNLQQTVNINAEFPNATDRTEIEEAFNNLVNKAFQYANQT